MKKIPQNVSQYIKSQQYIVDTYTIAKELIENSLDAHSTFIKIIITGNSLIIEDNGIGIDDLELVCKAGHTSKEDTTYSVLGLENKNENSKVNFDYND